MIYLDNHATTPCDPRVIEKMTPFFGEAFGNPSSSVHRYGQIALQAVEESRHAVAALIHSEAREVVFTSGATESNNLAILGSAQSVAGRNRIITSSIEHLSVLGPSKFLQSQGLEVVIAPVDHQGQIDMDFLKDAITENSLLVSVQAANNEIGTIQPINEISRLAHESGAIMHCDAAQALGKIPVDVHTWDVDLLSLSSHKIYGPKGVGALYLRGGTNGCRIKPILFGGGQENEFRPGTLNVPGIVGLGTACTISNQSMPEESDRIELLRNDLERGLMASKTAIARNGSLESRLPGNSSLTIQGIDAEALIANTPRLGLSTGSACASGAPEPSHVLLAIGLSRQEAYSTIRLGLGRFNTAAEMSQIISTINEAIERMSNIESRAADK
jgi:cysteine desulfurase